MHSDQMYSCAPLNSFLKVHNILNYCLNISEGKNKLRLVFSRVQSRD